MTPSYVPQLDADGLDQRQQVLYNYVVSFYRRKPHVAGADPEYDPTPVYAFVKCQFISTPEDDVPSPVGRTKAVNIFTLDQIHVSAGKRTQDATGAAVSPAQAILLQDTDYFTMVSGPNADFPEAGKWWALQGNPETKGQFVNYQMVYAKQTESPF